MRLVLGSIYEEVIPPEWRDRRRLRVIAIPEGSNPLVTCELLGPALDGRQRQPKLLARTLLGKNWKLMKQRDGGTLGDVARDFMIARLDGAGIDQDALIELTELLEEVAADEREACAKIVEPISVECAKELRARGNCEA